MRSHKLTELGGSLSVLQGARRCCKPVLEGQPVTLRPAGLAPSLSTSLRPDKASIRNPNPCGVPFEYFKGVVQVLRAGGGVRVRVKGNDVLTSD